MRDGSYEVTKDAAEFLSGVDAGVAVIVGAGKYRTGKSWLMNRIATEGGSGARATGRFPVGNTIKSCTKGIWLFPEVIKLGGKRVLVMDSEGIGSTDADASHDTRVFALALMLSSCFVYNSVGSIDESAIDVLSLVLKVSEDIRVASADECDDHAATNAGTLAEYMPKFHWVVRDFSLQLVNDKSEAMTPDEYLEGALRDTKDADRNRVRHAIVRCFPERSCTTLVVPASCEDELQRLDTMPLSELREPFVQQFTAFRSALLRDAPAKRVMGHKVNGKMLAEMARGFVDAINRGAAPVITNVVTMMWDVKNRDVRDAVVREFHEVTKNWSSHAVAVRDMEAALQGLKAEHVDKFARLCNIGLGTPCSRLGAELEAALDARMAEVCETNRRNVHQAATDAVAALVSAIDSSRNVPWSVVVERVNSLPDQIPAGDADMVVQCQARLVPDILRWGTAILGDAERAQLELTQAVSDKDTAVAAAVAAEARVSSAASSAEQLKRVHADILAQEQSAHRLTVEDMQAKLERHMAERADGLAAWAKKVDDLQVECNAAQERASAAEAEVACLQKRLEDAEQQDMKNCEDGSLETLEENAKLAQENKDLRDRLVEAYADMQHKEQSAARMRQDDQDALANLRDYATKSCAEIQKRADDANTRAQHLEQKVANDAEFAVKEAEVLRRQIERLGEKLQHAEQLLEAERVRAVDLGNRLELKDAEFNRLVVDSQRQLKSAQTEREVHAAHIDEQLRELQVEGMSTKRKLEGDIRVLQCTGKRLKETCNASEDQVREYSKLKVEHQRMITAMHIKEHECRHLSSSLDECKQQLADQKKNVRALHEKIHADSRQCKEEILKLSLAARS